MSTFSIRLNSGRPAYIHAIYGTFSASNLPGASATNGYIRQSLTAVTFDGATTNAVVTYTQPGGNNEVSGNLLAVDIKQIGWQALAVPVNVAFAPSVRVPDGVLKIVYDTRTYDGEGMDTSHPVECLNTEVHLTVVWGMSP